MGQVEPPTQLSKCQPGVVELKYLHGYGWKGSVLPFSALNMTAIMWEELH